MRLRANVFTGYGYGYGRFTGTGTSPPSSTLAPYGNSSASYYVPSGTAPLSTGISSPSAATFYGTASGALYKRSNSTVSGYPTYYPTHGPYPFPSGTIGTAVSTGDPSAKATPASGTAGSTGLASAPSSFGTSGAYTYTAPKGIPAEYFYHHKKPKRNVSRSLSLTGRKRRERDTDGNDTGSQPRRLRLPGLRPTLEPSMMLGPDFVM